MRKKLFAMTERVVDLGLLQGHDFVLIDVGASGGIDPRWHAFGKNLRVFAFEPLLGECDRLNQTIGNEKVKVLPYFVGSGKKEPSTLASLKNIDATRTPGTEGFIPRSSTLRAEILMGQKYMSQQVNNLGLTDKSISLDEFAAQEKLEDIDFVKIDTDGSDYEVLNGARGVLSRFSILGLTFEATFNPPDGAAVPTGLSDLDLLCRELGFSICDLNSYHYSRRQLPMPFVGAFAGATVRGPLAWADAYYVRDLCTRRGQEAAQKLSDVKLLKLACLFELLHLPDCAAELIETFRTRFDSFTKGHTEELLDSLVPPLKGKQYSYRQYNELFDRSPQEFFCGAPPALQTVYDSTSWKLTGPLRSIAALWSRAVRLKPKG